MMARAGILGLLLVLVACAPTRDEGDADARAGQPTGELLVFAAASLTDVVDALGAELRVDHPGLTVVTNLAGSQQLAGQLLQGAPADVFASADERQMAVVADAGLLTAAPEIAALNRLEIVVERGNPLGITGLEDLARPDLVVVLAAPEVPAGRYAAEALSAIGVAVEPDSLEADVRAVLGRVALGEADAGIVYRSDVLAAAGRVRGVAIAGQGDVVARYPVAVLADAPNPAAAEAFVSLLRSERGRAILAAAGLSAP